MYDSGVGADEFISSVASETDISPSVHNLSWTRWLNSAEQLIYSEILNECASASIDYADITENKINLSGDITAPQGCAPVEYDDVIRVFADENELEKSGVHGRTVFPDKSLYYTDYAGNLILGCLYEPEKITVIYRLRPKLKDAENLSAHICLPVEWLDMIAAKLRGEAYKIANEDGLAGKWLSDYNTQLESFKVWAASRNERYGG